MNSAEMVFHQMSKRIPFEEIDEVMPSIESMILAECKRRYDFLAGRGFQHSEVFVVELGDTRLTADGERAYEFLVRSEVGLDHDGLTERLDYVYLIDRKGDFLGYHLSDLYFYKDRPKWLHWGKNW